MEGLLVALFLHRLVHGFHHRLCQRQRHVPDAQPDQVGVGVGFLVIGHFVRDGAEEVAFVQFCIMRIDLHNDPPRMYIYL